MVTVAFSCRSSIESGRPTTMLLPTTATRLPESAISFIFSMHTTASAVHGAKPLVSPLNTFAILTGEIPSRSFAGSIIFSISCSLICFGSGRSIKIPSTDASALIAANSFLNASSEISPGNTFDSTSSPNDVSFFVAPFS